MNLNTFLRQPTTIHGLAVIAGGVGAALTHLATGNPTWDGIIALAAYALVHLGIDDNSVAEQSVTRLTTDIINRSPASALIGDAVTTATTLETGAKPAP